MLILVAACLATPVAQASDRQPGYVSGRINDVTSTTAGLMIRMDDNGVPTLCGNPANGWMLIPQSSSAMIGVFLSYWAAGKKNFVVYADPVSGSYCTIGQLDPAD
jgi:hypothetical protein